MEEHRSQTNFTFIGYMLGCLVCVVYTELIDEAMLERDRKRVCFPSLLPSFLFFFVIYMAVIVHCCSLLVLAIGWGHSLVRVCIDLVTCIDSHVWRGYCFAFSWNGVCSLLPTSFAAFFGSCPPCGHHTISMSTGLLCHDDLLATFVPSGLCDWRITKLQARTHQ